MKYRYKDLSLEQQEKLDKSRMVNKYTRTYHSKKRNKYIINRWKILDTLNNGKILIYEEIGDQQIIKIGSRQKYNIEGYKANLIIIYDINKNLVITCYYKETNLNISNLGKNLK